MPGIKTKFGIGDEIYAVTKENATCKDAPVSYCVSGPYIVKSIQILPRLKRAIDGLSIGSDLTKYQIYYSTTKTGIKFIEEDAFATKQLAYDFWNQLEMEKITIPTTIKKQMLESVVN